MLSQNCIEVNLTSSKTILEGEAALDFCTNSRLVNSLQLHDGEGRRKDGTDEYSRLEKGVGILAAQVAQGNSNDLPDCEGRSQGGDVKHSRLEDDIGLVAVKVIQDKCGQQESFESSDIMQAEMKEFVKKDSATFSDINIGKILGHNLEQEDSG